MLEKRDETGPGVLGSGSGLGLRHDLVDVLGVDLLGERLPRGEVPVERSDPDAGPAGNLLERGVRTELGEDLPAGCGQLCPVPRGITAERHATRLAKAEAASVLGKGRS